MTTSSSTLRSNGPLDARELTWSVNLDDPDAVADAFFFADSGTNDANKILTICGEQIGMNASNFFEVMNMDIGAFDNYFTRQPDRQHRRHDGRPAR